MSVPSSSTVMPRMVILTVRTTLAFTSLPGIKEQHEKKKKKKKKNKKTPQSHNAFE
jgi:hypothetical protein